MAARASRAAPMLASLLFANGAAWLWALTLFWNRPALVGIATLAWVLGLRHAVDADHIAAIDNVVRKLMQRGQRPVSAGLYFSLGHSTVVVAASVALAATAGAVERDWPWLHSAGALIGTSVSAAFLFAIGGSNLVTLRGLWRLRRRDPGAAADGAADGAALEQMLASRGGLARLLRPALDAVGRCGHMYPLGLVFGLGFDTATEVGVLSISATQSAQGLALWQVLVFPALFTAGMALVDAADSVLMVGAYGWAFLNPIRKLRYNLTVTAASVAVALLIGSLEALGLLAGQLGWHGRLWMRVEALNGDLTNFGFLVVAAFVLAWSASVLLSRGTRGITHSMAGPHPAVVARGAPGFRWLRGARRSSEGPTISSRTT
jgi:nickel/cobalt transporter (NiCoT) family protein